MFSKVLAIALVAILAGKEYYVNHSEVINRLLLSWFHIYLIFNNFYTLSIGPRRNKTCLRGFENNKGADQPAHPRNLISAFVIRLLESIIQANFQVFS